MQPAAVKTEDGIDVLTKNYVFFSVFLLPE